MPKSKSRKKRGVKSNTTSDRTQVPSATTGSPASPETAVAATRGTVAPFKPDNYSGLTMSCLAALGCWGYAYYLLTFSTDANRYLYMGMAVLLALIWSISFGIRLRRLRRR